MQEIIFFNAQHPSGKGELVGDGPAALIGYIDGMDIRNYSGKNVSIPDEASRSRVHVAAGEYVILGKSGQKLGDGTKLGATYDANGELMYISNDVDYNAFIPLSSKEAILYTAFEGATRKGVSSISRLSLQRDKGRWSSNLEDDECGVCGGSGIPDGECDCAGNVDLGCGCGDAGPSGCNNACGSELEDDECGVCGGSGIPDEECDCAGNVEDCAGECGGSAVEDELGGSAYYNLYDELGANVPKPDLEKVKNQIYALTDCIDSELILSCHDISDGGISCAIAEMTFANSIGCKVEIGGELPAETKLFSETSGFIIEVSKKNVTSLVRQFKKHGIDIIEIGSTNGTNTVIINNYINQSIDNLRNAWEFILT